MGELDIGTGQVEMPTADNHDLDVPAGHLLPLGHQGRIDLGVLVTNNHPYPLDTDPAGAVGAEHFVIGPDGWEEERSKFRILPDRGRVRILAEYIGDDVIVGSVSRHH